MNGARIGVCFCYPLPMDWRRKLGGLLLLAGTLLVCVYAVPTVYGAAMSRLAVAEFRAQSASHRDWDSARIRAYQRSLLVKFAPPEAVLRIPKIGLEVPVLEGDDALTLNRGVGHIPGTTMPGEAGNVGVAGHRDGFFRGLKDVVPGDVIEMQRGTGADDKTDRYVVRDIAIVMPSDTRLLKDTSESTLTLVTCFPFRYVGSAPQRYVVQAALVR
jgi:sortase A